MDIKEYISSGIIESYVLGLATEQEASLMECVRQNYPEVELAILEAQATLEDVATIQAIVPPTHLKDDIWSKINSTTDATATEVNTTDGDPEPAIIHTREKVVSLSQPTWRRWSIAAAVLLAASVGANIYLYRHSESVQNTLATVDGEKQQVEEQLLAATSRWQLINKPSVKSVILQGTENHADLQAKVLWDTEKKAVYLIADQMPQAPEGMQYQLWALVDGQPVDAGLVPLTGDKEIHDMRAIASAQAFAITLEKAGGSPVPTLSELRVIGNI